MKRNADIGLLTTPSILLLAFFGLQPLVVNGVKYRAQDQNAGVNQAKNPHDIMGSAHCQIKNPSD
jgi:hypothetical protein